MSRHRGLPRATLSTDTLMQSPREDMRRQPFAKFHNARPAQPALSLLDAPVILATLYFIQHNPQ